MSEATQLGADDVVDLIAQKFEEPSEVEEQEAKAESEEVEEKAEEVPEEDTVEEVTIDADELASYLGIESNAIDVDEDGTLKLKTKVDGEEGSATLGELLKSYQLEGHVTKRSMELAENRKQFEAKATQAKQQLSQKLQQADQVLAFAKQQALADFQSIDWNELQQTDPGQAALYRQIYNERMQQLDSVANNVNQARQEVNEAAVDQHLQQESARLKDVVPDWNQDSAKKVAEYLSTQGFTNQEIMSASDHRAIVLARKAMLFDKLQSQTATKAEVAKKKVKKVPRVLKPGASPSKTAKAQAQKNDSMKKFKRNSGSTDALADLLFDRM